MHVDKLSSIRIGGIYLPDRIDHATGIALIKYFRKTPGQSPGFLEKRMSAYQIRRDPSVRQQFIDSRRDGAQPGLFIDQAMLV